MCKITECTGVSKDIYGGCCYKHKRLFLLNQDDNSIIIENFTNNLKDYTKNEIINSIKFFNKDKKNYSVLKKNILFEEYKLLIQKYEKYKKNDIKIIKNIQNKYIGNKKNKINILRGEGFIDKSKTNNEIDFFTYETKEEISDKYYFSYKDESNILWFFDIRSFNKLIEHNQPNPYTMIKIPSNIIKNAKLLSEKINLGKKDEIINQTQLKLSRKQTIKQKCIDLFCDIESTTMYCHPQWFLSLGIPYLKRLYRNLEDLWNYRLQISNEIKSRICPPNGLVFTNRVSEVNGFRDKYDLQNLLLNEVMKFQRASTLEDKKMGFTYFMIGMVSVSKECYETHPFLIV